MQNLIFLLTFSSLTSGALGQRQSNLLEDLSVAISARLTEKRPLSDFSRTSGRFDQTAVAMPSSGVSGYVNAAAERRSQSSVLAPYGSFLRTSLSYQDTCWGLVSGPVGKNNLPKRNEVKGHAAGV